MSQRPRLQRNLMPSDGLMQNPGQKIDCNKNLRESPRLLTESLDGKFDRASR